MAVTAAAERAGVATVVETVAVAMVGGTLRVQADAR